MILLLYRPPKEHHAYRWGVYAQLPNGRKWLIHYDNIIKGGSLSNDELCMVKNMILQGGFVKVKAKWAAKVEKVLEVVEAEELDAGVGN